MEDKRYAYAVARIRALETRLLTSQAMRELLEAGDEESLFRILRATEYGTGKEAVEEKLEDESAETMSLLKELSLDAELTQLLTLKYDFHNLRVLLKAKHFPRDVEFLLVAGGNLDAEEIKYALTEGKMRHLPAAFVEAIGKAEAGFEKSADAGTIDAILDREFGDVFYRCSLEYGHEFFKRFAAVLADLSNIKNFFRVHNPGEDREFLESLLLGNGTLEEDLFLSYAGQPVEEFVSRLKFSDYSDLVGEGADYWKERSSVVRLERLIDEYILSFIRSTRYVVFGPEPLFAYGVLKDNELRSIRAIVRGRMDNVPVDMVRERIPLV